MVAILITLAVGFGTWALVHGICYLLSRGIANLRFGPGQTNLMAAIKEEGQDSPRVKLYRAWDLNRDELAPMFGVFAAIAYVLTLIDP